MPPARRLAAAVLILLSWRGAWAAAGRDRPEYETDRVRWEGTMRVCDSYAGAAVSGPAPLVLVLGRPGRSARYALDSWRRVADREGLIVAAVAPADSRTWRIPQDGPGLLHAVVRSLGRRYSIDRRRMYLFGYDAGGGFALLMSVLESRYFAAAAVWGGDLAPGAHVLVSQVERPIPVTLYRGSRDQWVGLAELTSTRDLLLEAGVAAELVEVKGQGSDFERKGHKVAGRIWAALSPHALSGDPVFRGYDR